jgi:ribosomal 50S subunit-recycling heat shock protein
LKDAQAAYGSGAFPRAVSTLDHELYEAAARGDRASLEAVVALADSIATNDTVHRKTRSDAAAIVESGRVQLEREAAKSEAQAEDEVDVSPTLVTADHSFREAENGSTEPSAANTPLDIVSSRYARGEISRDEYLQLKADLGS